jgi:signal transduction histidine kinase/CheY-like chemotaxis protein
MACEPAQAEARDPSRSALEYLHGLLQLPPRDQPDPDRLLAGLAGAFGVRAAGLVGLPEGVPLFRHPGPADGPWPWNEDPDLPTRAGQCATALSLARLNGSMLLTPVGFSETSLWLLWLEDDRSTWTDAEAGALALAGHVLTRQAHSDARPTWAQVLDRATRQHRLETTAAVTRRLAHDFGNVLTGILGFTELALAQQIPASTTLHSYLEEIYRAAQSGAQFTHQLRLLSRRHSASGRPGNLAQAVRAEHDRIRPLLGPQHDLSMDVPENLPAVALDGEMLRQVLAALLDNAREALSASGSITVSARAVELTRPECQELFGSARPGPHIEVCIADTGTGLSPDTQRRLFAEPFYSTKPRRRGFGLAVTYGVLHAHHGGLRLYPSENGVVARFVVPRAPTLAVPENGTAQTAAPKPESPPTGEKLLIADGDPVALQFVAGTLERAGYRVCMAATAEEAVQLYFGQGSDPFRLVVSDMVVPKYGGVELARRLRRRDDTAAVLLMTGHVTPDTNHPEFAQRPLEVLAKPFRPEGLLRAVRSALDKTTTRRPLPPTTGGEAMMSSLR